MEILQVTRDTKNGSVHYVLNGALGADFSMMFRRMMRKLQIGRVVVRRHPIIYVADVIVLDKKFNKDVSVEDITSFIQFIIAPIEPVVNLGEDAKKVVIRNYPLHLTRLGL